MERWCWREKKIYITHDTEKGRRWMEKIPTMFYSCLISTILHHFHIYSYSNSFSCFLQTFEVARTKSTSYFRSHQAKYSIKRQKSIWFCRFLCAIPLRKKAWFMHEMSNCREYSEVSHHRASPCFQRLQATVEKAHEGKVFLLIKIPLEFIFILRDKKFEKRILGATWSVKLNWFWS